jgi:hypothetical protein
MNEPQQMLGPMSLEILRANGRQVSGLVGGKVGMNREQLLEEMIVEKMIENKRLKEALTDCCAELSYLIDQTKSPIGGSVSKAFIKGRAALNAANTSREAR